MIKVFFETDICLVFSVWYCDFELFPFFNSLDFINLASNFPEILVPQNIKDCPPKECKRECEQSAPVNWIRFG